MSVISVKNLHKSFASGFWMKKTEVLKGLNFDISAGRITGFLGGNGAGKTTSIKCILGLLKADSGEISYFGESKLSAQVKTRLGFLPERPYFYEYLTGREILKFYGELSGNLSSKDLKQRIDQLLKKVDLYHVRDQRLRSYSKGMVQKIGLAQALVHRPDLVILDEPMSGLDPDGRHYLSELINETAQEGTAIFFSSHLLHDTQRLCDDIVVLKDGKAFFQGEIDNFVGKMDESIQVFYVDQGVKKTLSVKNRENLQAEIDRLRSQKHEICEIHRTKLDLERAFVSLVMEGRAE